MVIKEIQHARNISMAKGIGYDIQIEDEKFIQMKNGVVLSLDNS